MTFLESSSRSIFLFEHDLFGKPVPTFPDHALVLSHREKQKYGQQRRCAKNEGCELDDHTMGRTILRSRAMRPGLLEASRCPGRMPWSAVCAACLLPGCEVRPSGRRLRSTMPKPSVTSMARLAAAIVPAPPEVHAFPPPDDQPRTTRLLRKLFRAGASRPRDPQHEASTPVSCERETFPLRQVPHQQPAPHGRLHTS